MLTGVKAPKTAWQGDLTEPFTRTTDGPFARFDRQIIRLADSMLHYDNIVISLRKRNKITLGCRGTPQE
jgi:hypothetical protein